MSAPGIRDDAVKNDFAAAGASPNYDWILNAGAATPAANPAGAAPASSQQGKPDAGAMPASAPAGVDVAPRAAAPKQDGGAPYITDPHQPIGMQLEQSFANVWKGVSAEEQSTAGALRQDLWPKNLAELKSTLMTTGGDPIALLGKLGLDTGAYVFSPLTGAAKQLAGAPVRAATGSQVAGEVAGNLGAAAAGMLLPGGEAGAAEGSAARGAAEGAEGTPKPPGGPQAAETEPGVHSAPKPETGAATPVEGQGGSKSTAAAAPRAFDIAGDEPGAALKVTDDVRARAAAYITGKVAESPIEVHLDQLAQDPVAAVADIADVIPKDSVKPVDVTRMNAYALNLSPDEVMSAIRPKFASDEMYDAAAMAVKSSGQQFWLAAQKATAPGASDADMEQAIRAYALHNQFIGAIRDAKTDWGRAGRIQQEAAGSFSDFDRQIQDIISNVRPDAGPSDIEQVVRRTAQLDDPAKAPSFVSSLRWMGTKDGLLYGWYNWLLSNPAVIKAKIGSDFITAGLHTADTFIAEKFGSGGVKAGETSQLIAGYLGSFSDALRAARKGLMAGQSQFLGDARTLDGLLRTRLSALANGMDEAPEIAPEAQPTIQAMRYLRAALPTSWMGAADDFGKTFNYRAVARQLLYRKGVTKGLAGDALSNHVVEGLNNIAPDIHQQAVDQALRNTFTETMAPLPKAMQDWADKASINIRGAKVPIPLGRIIAPFMRIGANATRMVYQHSPLPLVFPSDAFKADLLAGGARADLANAKIGMGTGVASIGALLASGAVPGLRMTGRGPSDPELARHWRDAGNKPYHIYVGDRGFSMPLEPLATGLGIIADSADILRYAHDQDGEQVAFSTVLGIGSAMTSRSYNQGIANLLEALHNPDQDGERYGNNLIGSMVMPPGANAVRTIMDPFERAHYGLLDAIAARTPGFSSSLPPQRNLWGDPIRMEDGLLPGAFGRAFAKIHSSSDLAEPVDRWIENHLSAFPDSDQGRLGLNAPGLIQSWSAGRGVNAQIRLTPQQLDRLKVLAGNELKGPAGLGAKDSFNALVQGNYPDAATQSRWDQASDPEKALMMTTLWNKFRSGAKAQLLRENPDIQAAIGQGFAARKQALAPQSAQMPQLGAGP